MTTIATPGSTAPCSSVIFPAISAVPCCARATAAERQKKDPASQPTKVLRICYLPWLQERSGDAMNARIRLPRPYVINAFFLWLGYVRRSHVLSHIEDQILRRRAERRPRHDARLVHARL